MCVFAGNSAHLVEQWAEQVAKVMSCDMPSRHLKSNMAATPTEREAAFLAFNAEFERNG